MSAATPPIHRSLPAERESVTRKVEVHGANSSIEMYVTVSFYKDGSVGEIFVKASKKGSTLNGFANAWARMVSVALHRGIPWSDIYDMFYATRFDPSGATNSDLGNVHSAVDAIVRFVEKARAERENRA